MPLGCVSFVGGGSTSPGRKCSAVTSPSGRWALHTQRPPQEKKKAVKAPPTGGGGPRAKTLTRNSLLDRLHLDLWSCVFAISISAIGKVGMACIATSGDRRSKCPSFCHATAVNSKAGTYDSQSQSTTPARSRAYACDAPIQSTCTAPFKTQKRGQIIGGIAHCTAFPSSATQAAPGSVSPSLPTVRSLLGRSVGGE